MFWPLNTCYTGIGVTLWLIEDEINEERLYPTSYLYMTQDIRWEQRFSNYVKALYKLTQAVEYIKLTVTDEASITVADEIIKEGLIQRFEYTHELAWNVMKDYAAYQGNTLVGGSRDATREAFLLQLVKDGEVWMDMIGSRNKTSHTYHEDIVDEIYAKIVNDYYPAFIDFQHMMEAKRSGEQGKI